MVLVTLTTEDLKTSTGLMRTYLFAPKPTNQQKQYPGIILYSAIFQLQPSIERMARKIAGEGYIVAVPEIFHADLEIGKVLESNDYGRDLGTQLKKTTPIQRYKEDLDVILPYLEKNPQCNGRFGSIGFCVGGHISLLSALHPKIKSAACLFATDIVTGTLGSEDGTTDTLSSLPQMKGELLMIWGRQDPHVPDNQRRKIYSSFQDAKINFTWHEFNADHSFMMDEDTKGRYDPSVARLSYDLVFDLFHRTL